MAIKKVCEKIILIIITISILLSFTASPVANAGLGLKDGEFYYSGTTKGTYVVSEGIFSWLIDNLGKIADWIFGLCTMGIRMVFVGWTALIEKLLTWSVEQAGGISNNGGLVVDSTDITAIGDSSGNLTVQAIVYNRVPLFDINFFDLEIDRTVSPTGQVLRCEGCKKTCEECCGITKDNVPKDKNVKVSCKNCVPNKGCNECSNCEQYLANWRAEEPLVIKIREFVAMWYSIIRLLSLVAMLIVLIGIGIKMALSTVASEKAVYKRMFADWVVGVIILFAMHYLMYFIIIMNETLVETVQETANSINKSQIQFVNAGNSIKNEDGENEQIVADDEIEISIYEEIRSRAYDAKLSVGLSGMIMYITLVYFAIRYSIVYLKRYLTVIVLALMAPPLGVAYALQRAISGKSSSLKTWMNEFIMTVIIQIVHALVYAVFISTALALSLESVAGMIVALIFMNFALKTEKMFRQIFKMGEGDSLAGSVAEAGDAEKIHSTAKAIAGTVMAAKPIAGVMMNTPLAKGVKGVGKLGLAGGAAVANKIVNRKSSEEAENTIDQSEETPMPAQNGEDMTLPEGKVDASGVAISDTSGSASESKTIEEEQEEQALIAEGGESLRTKFAEGERTLNDPNATSAQKEQARKDMDNYVKYQMIMNPAGGKKKASVDAVPTFGGILGAHFKRAVNIENHFQATADGRGSALTQGFKSLFGTTHRDPHTGKQVYDGNGYFSQFNAANLLGLSTEDKKFLKEEAMAPLKAGLGFITFMAGMGTFVATPTIGAIGMGYGASKFGKVYKQIKGPSTKYKGTYGKAKFPARTVQNMHKQLLKNAYKEIADSQKSLDRGMIDKVKNDRPELYKAIMKDLNMAKPYTGLNVSSNVAFNYLDKKFGRTVGAEETGQTNSTVVPKKWSRTSELFSSTGSTANMGFIERYSLQRAEKETAAYEKEGAGLLKIAHEQEAELMMQKQDREILLSSEKLSSETDDEYRQRQAEIGKLSEAYKAMGYEYNSDNNTIKKRIFIQNDMLKDDKNAKANDIENAIDSVIQDIVYNTSGNISEIKSEEAIRLINEKLQDNKILSRDESISDLFTGGENTVKKLYEEKAQIANNQMQALVETGRRRKHNSLGTAIGNLESALENLSTEQENLDKLFESDSTKKDKNAISKEAEETVNKIRKQLILEKGTKNLDGAKLFRSIEEQRKSRKQRTSSATNSKERKKEKTQEKVVEKAEKEAIKALDDYIKAMNDIPAPFEDKEAITDIVIEKTITGSKEKLKESHKKARKVLQSKEFDESTIQGLIDGTESKIDEVKKNKKIVVDGETLEFNEAESKTLELLFKKMKEEAVFNEYTKNVLDLKDSSKTKAAKKEMHSTHVEYLEAKRDALYGVDNIANKYGEYGINQTHVEKMINGDSISDTVKELVDRATMQDYMKDANVTKGLNIQEQNFNNLDTKQQQKMKNNLSEFLNKELKNDISAVTNARNNYINANKKAILSGKVDISAQLDGLLGKN